MRASHLGERDSHVRAAEAVNKQAGKFIGAKAHVGGIVLHFEHLQVEIAGHYRTTVRPLEDHPRMGAA